MQAHRVGLRDRHADHGCDEGPHLTRRKRSQAHRRRRHPMATDGRHEPRQPSEESRSSVRWVRTRLSSFGTAAATKQRNSQWPLISPVHILEDAHRRPEGREERAKSPEDSMALGVPVRESGWALAAGALPVQGGAASGPRAVRPQDRRAARRRPRRAPRRRGPGGTAPGTDGNAPVVPARLRCRHHGPSRGPVCSCRPRPRDLAARAAGDVIEQRMARGRGPGSARPRCC